jgi:hypothetical protein
VIPIKTAKTPNVICIFFIIILSNFKF